MIYIFGKARYLKELGDSVVECMCPRCKNYVTMQAKIHGYRLTVFFIPLLKVSARHIIVCPICSYGKELEKQLFQTYLPKDITRESK